MKYKKNILYILSFAFVLSFVSCDKFLEVELPGNVVPVGSIYSDPEFIKSAVHGMYAENLVSNPIYYYMLPLYLSIVTDESFHNLPNNTNFEELKYNVYNPTNTYIGYLWSYPYKSILLSNDLISHLSENTVIAEEEKRHYIGEAKYFRAYAYFVLINIFGDVPWVKSSNIFETELLPRTSKEKIITEPEGIIDDLIYAETALANSANSNSKVTKAAASALLARVYLYQKDWINAEAKADSVIKTSGRALDALENVFLRTSKESIFKVSSNGSSPSYQDRTYIGLLYLNASYFRLTEDFLASFEEGDQRKVKWVKDEKTYFHGWKFKRNAAASAGSPEELPLLRLAEQYLIRAEARAQQSGKLTGENGAIADLNIIRRRAELDDLPETLPQAEVLRAVENERRHELFLEEGHRWWDLVRTKRVDAVLGAFTDKQWESYKALFPVPSAELTKNPNLKPNNPGYGDIK
jgi:hypothetical protein